ncbi:MAG: hypothetical protein J1F20_02325 [Muribaculaceae bacterium]|nr:hypothetical protein [Muribaculaceae bacterium]
MSNVQIKLFFLSVLVTLLTTGCSGGSIFGPSLAEELSCKIDTLMNRGEYKQAIEYIDTLNLKYPTETKLRKKTMLTRAKAMEGLISDSIPLVDAQIEQTQQELDSLKQYFTAVRETGLPGYIIAKEVQKTNILNGNNIQPRLGDALSSWVLVAHVKGQPDITGLTIEIAGRRASSMASDASARRVKGSSGEMFSFTTAEADPIAQAIAGDTTSPAILYIETTKGPITVNLNQQVLTAIWRTYQLSQVREQHRLALVHRELLERKLAVARNQIANFTSENSNTSDNQ